MAKRKKRNEERAPSRSAREVAPVESALQVFRFRGDFYQGPIPPAEALEHYERVLSGAADRIIAMAERQAAHRHSLESAVVVGNVRSERTGQLAGTLVFLAGLVFAAYVAHLGMPWLSLGTFFTNLSAFTALLILGRRKGRAELAQKRGGELPAG